MKIDIAKLLCRQDIATPEDKYAQKYGIFVIYRDKVAEKLPGLEVEWWYDQHNVPEVIRLMGWQVASVNGWSKRRSAILC